MAIDSTSSVAAAATSQLRLDDLLRVLLTELTHQDPFDPADNKDFMAQIAQFASLETSQQLNDNIVQLLSLQALNQSVGLIGRQVSAVLDNGTIINGKVEAITLANGAPRLTINSNSQIFAGIALGQLQTVRP